MPSLKELQSDFIQSVRQNRDYTHGNEPERLAVYRRNLDGGLASALELTYPVTLALVGKDFFRGCVREFRETNLPQGTNLDAYGAEFGDFLSRFEPAAEIAYLPDVARLEWVLHRSNNAAMAPFFALEQLPQDPGKLASTTLTPHPAAFLFCATYPALDIWQWQMEGAQETLSLDDAEPCFALITRPELHAQATTLNAADFAFLSAVFDGRPLLEAHEIATQADAGFDLVICLQTAILCGSFTTS